MGRPLGALALNSYLFLFRTLDSFLYARVFAVLCIASSAYLFYRYIVDRFDVRKGEAAALSFSMFLLPSMAINAFWLSNFVPAVLPLPVVIFLYQAFHRAFAGRHSAFGPLRLAALSLVGLGVLCVYAVTTVTELVFNGNVVRKIVLPPNGSFRIDREVVGIAHLGENQLVFRYSEWNHRASAMGGDPRDLAVPFVKLTVEQ